MLAPKAAKLSEYVAPHKPHTKLSEVLAKHKGQADWTEPVVDDDNLHADYISMGPGKKTPRRMNADTREWWVIQDGQIRFTIDGQEPFVASKGYLVQVPYRNMYTMETVGDRPSLRFEVNIAKARKMYPMDEKPVPVAGFNFVPVRVPGKGTYAEGNKPFVDFNAVAAGTDKTRRFVHDDRAVANIILGPGIRAAAADQQGSLPSGERRVLVHPPQQDSLQHRGTAGLRSRSGRHRLRAEDALPSGELCRQRPVVPPGDERLHGSVAFVRSAEREIGSIRRRDAGKRAYQARCPASRLSSEVLYSLTVSAVLSYDKRLR